MKKRVKVLLALIVAGLLIGRGYVWVYDIILDHRALHDARIEKYEREKALEILQHLLQKKQQ